MARILVADDEAPMREVITMACRMEGHTVAQAADSASTVAAYVTFKPDLIILDLAMPGGGGPFVTRQLRALGTPLAPLAPILVVSGFVGGLSSDEREAIGAFDIVEKPFTLEGLRMAIRRALSRAGPAEEPTPGGPPVDRPA